MKRRRILALTPPLLLTDSGLVLTTQSGLQLRG